MLVFIFLFACPFELSAEPNDKCADLDCLKSKYKEFTEDDSWEFKGDVFSHFESEEYDTPLKKQMFMKTAEYKKIEKEWNHKQKAMMGTYLLNTGFEFEEYLVKEKRFEMYVSDTCINKPDKIKDVQGIYFQNLQLIQSDDSALMPIALPEEIAVKLENNKAASVYFIFELLGRQLIPGNCSELYAGEKKQCWVAGGLLKEVIITLDEKVVFRTPVTDVIKNKQTPKKSAGKIKEKSTTNKLLDYFK